MIPHGVDTDEFNPKVSGEEVRSQLKVGEVKIVLFVGVLSRWHRYKGLDVLMEAFAVLKSQRRAPGFAEQHDWSIGAEQTEKLYERALAAQ